MNQLFSVSSEAYRDLFEIWRHISSDSVDLADRIDAEFLATFESLGLEPGTCPRGLDTPNASFDSSHYIHT